ncbi:hypothetical protein M3226_02690 [Neobacillus cucumis]|uniref:hypothetical protein n=1 Tax=Neobacillus cucumis TaxID=1740721 RepID=UPI00203BC1F6|nr:hypothetical protein [Neobacillus cucumis]MCM3724609.1 hypothetical protein [Neobacillus cucumis]
MITNFLLYGKEIDIGLNSERRYNNDEYHMDLGDIRALSRIVRDKIGLRKEGETATSYGERTLTGLAQLLTEPDFFLYIDHQDKEGNVTRERLVWVGPKNYRHITSNNQKYLKQRALIGEQRQ